MDSKPCSEACCPRFHIARISVQPLAISTLVSVHMKLPPMFPPQCATVSTSVQPGSHVSQFSALASTRLFTPEAGLGGRIFLPTWTLKSFNNRSMLAALMASNYWRFFVAIFRCGVHNGRASFILLPHGWSITIQHFISASTVTFSYCFGAPCCLFFFLARGWLYWHIFDPSQWLLRIH